MGLLAEGTGSDAERAALEQLGRDLDAALATSGT
jgi:hypothetical protein